MQDTKTLTPKTSKISVVATPIGHLADISQRAIETLQQADVIFCEDTRVTRKLLSHLNIHFKTLITYADHNEAQVCETWLPRIRDENLHVALVSDAGTPLISDPGYRLIHGAKKSGLTVEPIPGPNAVIALISASGLACDRFQFVGFFPEKEKARNDLFEQLKGYRGIVAGFESMHRIEASLRAAHQIFGNIDICIGRELTKLHEEIRTMSIAEGLTWVQDHMTKKGELSVLLSLGGHASSNDQVSLEAEVTALMKAGMDRHHIQDTLRNRGFSKRDVYQMILQLKRDADPD